MLCVWYVLSSTVLCHECYTTVHDAYYVHQIVLMILTQYLHALRPARSFVVTFLSFVDVLLLTGAMVIGLE